MLKSLQRLFPIQKIFPLYAHNANYEDISDNLSQADLQEMSLSYIFLLGLALILSGIVFFFAHNWQAIPPIIKFASIQFLFCISIFTAYKLNLDTLLGKLALLLATLLIGVFLAVFGQVYQTGADSYTLFLTWSIAVLPFAFISHFSLVWALLTLLINLTIYLWLAQLFGRFENIEQTITLTLMLLNGVLLTLREYLAPKIEWLNSYSTRRILFCILQTFIVIELFTSILFFDSFAITNKTSIVALIASLLLFFVYRFKYEDIFIVSNTLVASTCMLIVYIVRHTDLNLPSVTILCLSTIGIFTLLGLYLERLSKKFKGVESNTVEDSTSEKEKKTIDKSSLIKLVIGISACVSVVILLVLFFLIYERYFNNSPFLLIAGIPILLLSVYIHRKDRENILENSFFKLYKGVTLLLLSYVLITVGLLEYFNLPLAMVAIILAVLSQILYPILNYAGSRFIISLYTLALIHTTIYDDSTLLLLMAVLMLITLTIGLKLETKFNFLMPLMQALFFSFSIKIISFLLGFLEFQSSTLYYILFSSLLALWGIVLYFFYTKKLHIDWNIKNINKNKAYLAGILCFIFFVFFDAYAILYLIGMLLLSLYFEKIALLRQTVYFSIIVIPLYYYNLDVNLLTKSLILFVSGALLLIFCARHREALKHA